MLPEWTTQVRSDTRHRTAAVALRAMPRVSTAGHAVRTELTSTSQVTDVRLGIWSPPVEETGSRDLFVC